MVAIVLMTLAVLAQAGVLISMYLMSRRLSLKAESLMDDSRKLMTPLETITGHLRTVSEDMTQAGKIAREQALHVQEIVNEAHADVRQEITEIRARIHNTVDEARRVAMRPIREYSAIATGIAVGIRTFFGRKKTTEQAEPAAPAEIIIVEGTTGDRPAA